ncbi:hypothetical protein GXN76_13420 [Kroppenstedtia pulmonis]|uniref:Uncharacterized protein n=1 Tax=Kroppenstedtia pulmonis TaxID=1380685 RepID=A0A7D4C890_9BACL|nr:hypothetical protein [Kroppenstedtia pulmonis]QKG85376.1 hypothetical protein GXN76_13420 [Kroppenstedtia pulmonis]
MTKRIIQTVVVTSVGLELIFLVTFFTGFLDFLSEGMLDVVWLSISFTGLLSGTLGMFRNIFILPSALLLIISIGLLMLWGLASFIISM